MTIKTISYQKEQAEIVKGLIAIGNTMDRPYKQAWSHLIAAYKLVGWKDVFYLILKFQKHVKSKYQFKQ